MLGSLRRVAPSARAVGTVPRLASSRSVFVAITSGCGTQQRNVVVMATKAGVEQAAYEPATLPSISTSSASADAWNGDLLALGICEDAIKVSEDSKSIVDGTLSTLNAKFANVVDEVLATGDFKGQKGNSATLRVATGSVRYVTLVGLGKSEDLAKPSHGPSVCQAAGAAVAKACKENKLKTAAFVALGAGSGPGDSLPQEFAYGVLTGAWESTRFKSEPKLSPLESVTLLHDVPGEGVALGVALARANLFTRYLVDAPPNVCTPTYLAGAASHIAAQFPDTMTCSVLEREECEAMGMGCYLGVAECSDEPPKFIHLTYKPKGEEASKKVALVGKGVTFDAGGYNIKTGMGCMIEKMKFDMGGAGAVLGAARAIAELSPPGIEVHFVSAACENMIDGKGLVPGNILVSASGKTVEVGNTDAEGRLTLADALWYVQEKVGPTRCIDIATLTGAQIVALGTGMGAVMSPSDDLAAEIASAGKGVGGEKWWRLPLEDAYFEMLKSSCADMNNIGGRAAGTITAGLFIKQFVDTEKLEWAHLDMAGPVWDDKLGGPTGFGAVSLAKWVLTQQQ